MARQRRRLLRPGSLRSTARPPIWLATSPKTWSQPASDAASSAVLRYRCGRPTSINIDTFGTGKLADSKIVELVRQHFELKPRGLIQMLDLLRPIYRDTAAYGHFGREEPNFTWEQTDKADALRADAGL